MYCPSFPEAPTMHTLISSSHQLTGTQIWPPAFRARHEKENAGVTEAQQGRPQCSGVSEGLPAFVSSFTILRADMKAWRPAPKAMTCRTSFRNTRPGDGRVLF